MAWPFSTAASLLAPTLAIFLSLMTVYTFLRVYETDKALHFLIPGFVFGLLVLTRSNAVLFLAVLPLYLYLFRGPQTYRAIAKCLLFFLLGGRRCPGSQQFEKHAITGGYTPFSVQGGINFFIGNNPEATGYFMSPGGIIASPVKQVAASKRIAEQRVGRELTYGESSRYWLAEGLRYLAGNPVDACGLYLRKIGYLLQGREIDLNINYYQSRTFTPIFNLHFIPFGMIAPLGLRDWSSP